MIETLFSHPLGPSLILALGSLLLSRMPRGRRWHARWTLSLALLIIAGALAALVLLRTPLARAELRWVWQPLTVAGSALHWQLDGWNWLAALLILLITAAAVAVQDEAAGERVACILASRTMGLAAAALAFVFSANVITLATSWVLLDAAIALRLLPGEAEEPASRSWSLLSLAGPLLLGVLLFGGESRVRSTLAAGPFQGAELVLLWLAALIRIGVYPVHFWLTGPGRLGTGDRMALHLIGPVAGIWLLGRVDAVAGAGWFSGPQWMALGALAVLGTALVAWTTEDRGWAWRWIALNRASLVMMAASSSAFYGPSALLWPLVTFGLGMALLAVGQEIRQRWGWRVPLWIGAAVLWGMPGTVGFLVRGVVSPAEGAGEATGLFGVFLIAEALLAAALWQAIAGKQWAEDETPGAVRVVRREELPALMRFGAVTVVLVVPLMAWGLAPQQLATLAGLPEAMAGVWTLAYTLGHAQAPVWASLLLAGAIGVALGVLRARVFQGMRGWQHGISAIVSLEWFYQGVGVLLGLATGGLQYFARLGEGEGYLGWLVLAGLVFWILLRA